MINEVKFFAVKHQLMIAMLILGFIFLVFLVTMLNGYMNYQVALYQMEHPGEKMPIIIKLPF